ncbi:chromatin licensing and DNA replication factor double parked [Leptinotarsa decemlineata]|uniref:chromatin licensing and DNA replication factor double parked n=1 Tax=Leptinotarsa decemlineata TaxID=7539 RepID=UPI003D306574
MAQPSVACFFNTRKRSATEDLKINRARKVLVLDSCDSIRVKEDVLKDVNDLISETVSKDVLLLNSTNKFQEKEKKIVMSNNIMTKNNQKSKTSTRKVTKTKAIKNMSNYKDIQQLITNMKKEDKIITETQINPRAEFSETTKAVVTHLTPPTTPTKISNALDNVKEKPEGPSLKEIRKKLTRSSRLAELKASMNRFQENAEKLKEIEKKTSLISESPKLKNFKTIELEVETSPQKVFSPEKAYLSPKKDSTVRRNLIHLLSPTKNAVSALSESPSKRLLLETSKPALTLPYKYRYLAEIFRCIDIVCQILFNRKETITFRKLKQAVEEMLKRNLTEKHMAQIKKIYPDSFEFTVEKLKVYGAGVKQERWELVLTPKVGAADTMNSEVLLQRRRKLFSILLDRVKSYHQEFLFTLIPPMVIDKEKITRWHPEFDIEKLPDIETSPLPEPPKEEVLLTGKDVLEKARQMFNCNIRVEQALQKLKNLKDKNEDGKQLEEPRVTSSSALKGIPNALLEKVRQRQAAKALLSMTRSVDQEKEVQVYSRLPELARLTRNLFVSEKKSVLPLDIVVDKLGNSYRGNLTKVEMEEHLKVISKEVPTWLVFHDIRNRVYLKLAKNADVSMVIDKLENIVKQKSHF